jgi:hypothetical protein
LSPCETHHIAPTAFGERWVSQGLNPSYALYRAATSEIASFAVIVDAKDDGARRFYERESFLPFPDRPMKLFRPMADLKQLFNETERGR